MASRYPQLALEWSRKNGTLLPENFNERSTKNVWWKCSTCGHEYRAVIKSKVHGLKCPVCTRNAVLPGYNDLATTDPELAQEWNTAKNTRSITEKEAAMISAMRQADERARQDAIALLELHTVNKKI